jgi:ABC-2 type transport system ATP-binding protein
MGIVKKICDRVIFIKKGGYIIEDTPERMIGLYMKMLYSASEEKEKLNRQLDENGVDKIDELTKEINIDIHEAKEFSAGNREGNRKLEITKAYFSDKTGMARNVFSTNDDIKVNLEFKKNQSVEDATMYFEIYSHEGWRLSYHDTEQDGILITDIKESNLISFEIKDNPYLDGRYYLSVGIRNGDGDEVYDFRNKHYYFVVNKGTIKEQAKIKIQCDWNL